MFQTNYITALKDINYLQNTKETVVNIALENIVSTHV